MRKNAHWLECLSSQETLDVLCDVAHVILQKYVSDRTIELDGLVRKREFAAVVDYEVSTSLPLEEVRVLRQAIALFSKLESLDIGIDKEKAALQTFMEAEARCRETNDLLRAVRRGAACLPKDVAGILYMASRHVARLLGPVPSVETLGLRFGPGATSLTKKREASIKRKLSDGVSCSEDLIQWAPSLLAEMPYLSELHADFWCMTEEEFYGLVPVQLDDGVISFVRKNAKTDRTTETQPTLNGMLQLAVGDGMLQNIRRVPGLDLKDQTLNRRLARIGSITGALATLDLRSASNLLAYELVRDLTPVDWFALLSAARVGHTRVPHHGRIKLEMFSGMGNGFTFPLQSIIFYSLALATAKYQGRREPIVSVYGDDIIIDVDVVPLFKRVLSTLGFIVNEAKSFDNGPFRESCGADWLSGFDVRPVYVKSDLSPAVLFTLHNGLVRKGWSDVAEFVKQFIHSDLQLYGPDGYGDGHLLSENWREYARSHRNAQRGWNGLIFDSFAKSAKRDWAARPGDRVLPSYSIYRRGSEQLLVSPDANLAFDPKQVESAPGFKESNILTRDKPWGQYARFLRAWATGHGATEEPSLPIPFANARKIADLGSNPDVCREYWMDPQGDIQCAVTKATTFPGEDGYRKIAIYTLA